MALVTQPHMARQLCLLEFQGPGAPVVIGQGTRVGVGQSRHALPTGAMKHHCPKYPSPTHISPLAVWDSRCEVTGTPDSDKAWFHLTPRHGQRAHNKVLMGPQLAPGGQWSQAPLPKVPCPVPQELS